jgi:heme/copper-type cytochrome/quinol oxidase subunit 2
MVFVATVCKILVLIIIIMIIYFVFKFLRLRKKVEAELDENDIRERIKITDELIEEATNSLR